MRPIRSTVVPLAWIHLLALVLLQLAAVPSLVWAQSGGAMDAVEQLEADREGMAAEVGRAQSKVKAIQDKKHDLIMQIGEYTMEGYGVAVILFVIIPLGLFLAKFIYNLTIGPIIARKRTLSSLRENAKATPHELIQQAMDAMKRRNFQEAAELFAEGGDYYRAGSAFEKQGALVMAADHYKRARRNQEAARVFAQAGRHKEAASQWEAARLPGNAANEYMQIGDQQSAARCFEQAGNKLAAAKLYEKLGNLHKAAKLYGQGGEAERSAKLYEELVKSEQTAAGPAAQLGSQQTQRVMEQAQSFRRGQGGPVQKDTIVQAIHVSLQDGDVDGAADLYMRSDSDLSDEVMAGIPYHTNASLNYAQMFLKARDYKAAASVFDQIGKYHEAAELYARGGEFYSAGEMFEMAGLLEEAATNYAKGGAPGRAATMYIQLGDKSQAAECYGRAEQFSNAAELLEELGEERRALAMYLKVPQTDAGYLEAQGRIETLQGKGVTPPGSTLDGLSVSEIMGAAATATASQAPSPSMAPPGGGLVIEPTSLSAGGPSALDADAGIEQEMVGAMEGIEWLRESTYFTDLSLDALRQLHGLCETRSYQRGQVIIDEGEPGENLFIVKRGRVGVGRTQDGQTKKIAELNPGDHFGELSLLTGSAATAKVLPMEPVEVFVIGRGALERFMASNETAALSMFRAFTTALAHRLKKTSDLLVGGRGG